ncbi:MAG: alanine-tRNA synthetase second additional domain-containing protein [[Eubacterium] sulci]|jgi:hypothetical protein|nr:alanine-tRNA synthetase second additional domain-containing protein [[Eubacterium] sulci]MBF1150621.1 alanine-tRNA synthetase second additional domain-containing protein [[Eubacterium] sulci]MBF1155430.1 alanine-tRNA synthetase second additional domain-containing protein [[Eubacterium] sulci]MBF1156339.1 alanine-tRNA synthetase second additional domain-containing protein [[Eubacterium] sulci]MBF1157442.1 alanine-tRNA synthetase second additional domain-containing protein [[Eubacterium] sulci
MEHSDKLRSHLFTTYYAPRGRSRIYGLGIQLAQQYLSPFDKLIGVIGEAGSGKSALIKGMFPGLELTNDDDGVNVRPLPILQQDYEQGFFTPHTYHLDIRFEMGFHQLSVLAGAILQAIKRGKRVIVEHFDIVYPMLNMNADLLIGVGEEIVLTRPRIFGPFPEEIYKMVYTSLPYRLMAHTAEDICEYFMPKDEILRCTHDDIRHGFIVAFPDYQPNFDLVELENKVNDVIKREIPVSYYDDNHIKIGDIIHPCTGPRTHVSNTKMIKEFHLLHHFIYDVINKRYLMVGCVGENSLEKLKSLDSVNEHMAGMIK